MDSPEVIDRIVELQEKGFSKEIDGLTFMRGGLEPLIFEPHPDNLKVRSLTGLVDYIQCNLDELGDMKKYALHIVHHKDVRLLSAIKGKLKERDYPVIAQIDEGLKDYPFGNYQDLESFNIALRTMFDDTEDRELLLGYVSRVTDKTEIIQDDDGISQSASIAKGLTGATVEIVKLPSTVVLKPYRTFREIEQVESTFIFRMKKGPEGVRCALFEADGGAWRHETMKRIQGYLLSALPEIMTIA